MPAGGPIEIVVTEFDAGRRLDSLVASAIPHCTRHSAASLANTGQISVSGRRRKAGYKVKTGDIISGVVPETSDIPAAAPLPEPIPIPILYEDDAIIVVNKPPGMVVHPAPGHTSGTLVNAMLHHLPEIQSVGGEFRSGIVHRLDKDTSGVMLLARTPASHQAVSADFKARRQVKKKYLALVFGGMKEERGTIDLPLGRHPADRKKISTQSRRPRNAETAWRVMERYDDITLLEVEIKTGRTHQIRVHCAAMHHPVVGDYVYGSRKALNRMGGQAVKQLIRGVKRQMLHAWQLGIVHPGTGGEMMFEAPMPDDMKKVVESLRNLHKYQ